MAEGIDLDKARRAIRKGKAFTFPDVSVTVANLFGRRVIFATDKQRDPIQRTNRSGQFYESEELEVIRRVFPMGGVFVDIGANVGNHSLFVAHFLSPSVIIPFEPNPLAYKLLLANVGLNGFGQLFDLSHIGMGLGESDGEGFGMESVTKNLGSARMIEGEGDLQVRTGDACLEGAEPDLIKIDVEGMEIGVLKGLEKTVQRTRPWIFIEVLDDNLEPFLAWVEANGYVVDYTYRRYRNNENYLLRPRNAGTSEGGSDG